MCEILDNLKDVKLSEIYRIIINNDIRELQLNNPLANLSNNHLLLSDYNNWLIEVEKGHVFGNGCNIAYFSFDSINEIHQLLTDYIQKKLNMSNEDRQKRFIID